LAPTPQLIPVAVEGGHAFLSEPSLPDLRPSTAATSIRLPVPLLEELKSLANERDVPYQSLMKVFLAD
jgi:predicted DNA binding CopG/RHH family protein